MTEHFELLYIVSMKHTGDDLQKVMENVAKIIKDHGGEITHDDIYAKQKLAYPIKKVHQGTYVVVEFDMEKANVINVDKLLRLDNTVLRYLIIKKKVKTAEELEREKNIQEKLLKKKEEELAAMEGEAPAVKTEESVSEVADEDKKKEEEPVSEVANEDKEKEEEPVSEVADEDKKKEEEPVSEVAIEDKKKEEEPKNEDIKEKAKKSKVSLDDLDKKLDEILTDDIL